MRRGRKIVEYYSMIRASIRSLAAFLSASEREPPPCVAVEVCAVSVHEVVDHVVLLPVTIGTSLFVSVVSSPITSSIFSSTFSAFCASEAVSDGGITHASASIQNHHLKRLSGVFSCTNAIHKMVTRSTINTIKIRKSIFLIVGYNV
jgi:hypothetical protein